VLKATYLSNLGRKGWSESWYANPGSNDLVTFMDTANKALTKRLQLVANTVTVDAIRVSDMDIRGASHLKRLDNVRGLAPGVLLDRDVPPQAMLCRCEDESGLIKRPWLCRGWPDDWFEFEIGRELRDRLTGCARRIASEVAGLSSAESCEAVIDREHRIVLELLVTSLREKLGAPIAREAA